MTAGIQVTSATGRRQYLSVRTGVVTIKIADGNIAGFHVTPDVQLATPPSEVHSDESR